MVSIRALVKPAEVNRFPACDMGTEPPPTSTEASPRETPHQELFFWRTNTSSKTSPPLEVTHKTPLLKELLLHLVGFNSYDDPHERGSL